jgi:aminopeptidase YwaD
MMLEQKAREYVETLTAVRPNRRTGSAGNREATRYFAGIASQWSYEIDSRPFPALDYVPGESWLSAGALQYPLHNSPYSMPVSGNAPLLVVRTVDELEGVERRGAVLLLVGEISREQLMPKNFVFYNPDHHKQIYSLLESARPAAIVAATGHSPEQVGALHPYPIIVDGDFTIPSAYCTEELGRQIAEYEGHEVEVSISGTRSSATANNVIARRPGRTAGRIVITAHIDAYEDTPGALDNASGTATLLLLAELLADHNGRLGIEIDAWNGEDHYSAGGQMDYLSRYGHEMEQVVLAINIDDIGYIRGASAWSAYECPPDIEHTARDVFGRYPGLTAGERWWSGDHMVFVQAGRPAIAFTAERIGEVMSTVTHTERDKPDLVDPARLVEAATAIAALVRRIGG